MDLQKVKDELLGMVETFRGMGGPLDDSMDGNLGRVGSLPTQPEQKVLFVNGLYDPQEHRVLVLGNADDLLTLAGY